MLEELCLHAYWYNRPIMGKEYLDKIKAFLVKLKHIENKLNSLYVCGHTETDYAKIDHDFKNLEVEIITQLSKPSEYIKYRSGEKGEVEFSPSANAVYGFSNTFTSALSITEEGFSISTKIGGCEKEIVNLINIFAYGNMIDKQGRLLRLFKETILFWQPQYAIISRGSLVLKSEQLRSDIPIGLITYFSDVNVKNYVPDEYICENFNGGVIVKLPVTLSQEDDDKIVKSIVTLWKVLKPQGCLEKNKHRK